ncbi:hypothetical protein BASA81_000211 [Batrachochytrium salamandrivorans]|nr:hypothetical protein BASA81_000211 [Batrachochytrium salamandrivorans]
MKSAPEPAQKRPPPTEVLAAVGDVKITYANQHLLGKLPLPPLQHTLDKFLSDTIQPLLTRAELEATKAAVESFSEAAELYSLLEQQSQTDASYIERYWDSAYLDYDAAIPINVNPVFILEDDPTPARSKLLPRAVSLVFSSLKFARAVRTGTLVPDKVKDTPLCMDQFKRLFGSARVPNGSSGDTIINSSDSTHICVICEDQFYYFHCLYPGTFDLAVTERELTKILSQIIDDATSNNNSKEHRVGLLTTESRSKWRSCRTEMKQASENNCKVLEKIDHALFVLCLDVNYEADEVSEACANILHGSPNGGTCANRWYDKLQLIVTKGGTAGVNFEHSAVDGHSVLRYASDVFTDTVIRFAQTIQLGGIYSPLDRQTASVSQQQQQQPRPDCKPRKLEFDLPRHLAKQIHYAESRLADAIFQNHTITMEFTGYGKTFLVQNQLSPDATAQIAMQTAFFELYGEAANTYESVLTKSFYHGRTEAGRSCTAQAVSFMHYYCDDGDRDVHESIRLLRAAAKQHSKMTGEASKAMGVDRLLYAMECMATERGMPKPAIFTSPGYIKLNQSVLSTSNCGNPSLRFFGFGPVCPQGFGIGYIIKDDSIHFMITSKRRQTERYRDTLQVVLERIHDDLLKTAPILPQPKSSLLLFRSNPSATNLHDLLLDGQQQPSSPLASVNEDGDGMSSPAQIASQNSMKAVMKKRKQDWVALFAPDACIEDPVGISPLDPTGKGHIGTKAVEKFWDDNVAPNELVFNITQSLVPEGSNECCNVGQIITRVNQYKVSLGPTACLCTA